MRMPPVDTVYIKTIQRGSVNKAPKDAVYPACAVMYEYGTSKVIDEDITEYHEWNQVTQYEAIYPRLQ